MKKNVLTFYSRLLSFFMVLLGFTGCDDNNSWGGAEAMYGTPSAKFKVNGKIVSQEDKSGIENIRVVLVPTRENEEAFYGDTVYTNSKGEFEVISHDFPLQKVTFKLKLDDVDGDKNGSYDSKIQSVVFENPEYKGGESWYKGEAEKKLGNIEMTPSNKEEE